MKHQVVVLLVFALSTMPGWAIHHSSPVQEQGSMGVAGIAVEHLEAADVPVDRPKLVTAASVQPKRSLFRSILGSASKSPRPPRNPKVNSGKGMAITGFVLGILGTLTTMFPIGIAGLPLGIISLQRYRRGLNNTRGLAIAAIVFGSICTLGTLLFALVIVAFNNGW